VAPALVQESWCGDSMTFCRRDVPCAFLLLGCSGGCGACGWLESGPSSISPPFQCLPVASFNPGSEEFGVHPQPMYLQRWFDLLQLKSLPLCVRTSPDLGDP
jgi:hypothetical protein